MENSNELALRTVRKILIHFDSGGESVRSKLARLLSCAFQLYRTEFKIHVEPLELPELHALEHTDFITEDYQYPLFDPVYLEDLQLRDFVCVLLYVQHKEMDAENLNIMFNLSAFLQRCLKVDEIVEYLKSRGLEEFSIEELLMGATERLCRT